MFSHINVGSNDLARSRQFYDAVPGVLNVPPGTLDTPFGPLYLAYMRDPDGNKLCAFHQLG